MIHTFHQRSSLHFTSLHFPSLHFTTLQSSFFASLNVLTFRHHPSKPLHFPSLHFTSILIFRFPERFDVSSPPFKNPSLFLTYNYFPNPLSKNTTFIENETIHFSAYGSAVEWGNLKTMFGLNLLITALTYEICKLTLRSDSRLNSEAISQSWGHRVDPHIKFIGKFQSTILWLSLPHCLIVVCAVAQNTRFIIKLYSLWNTLKSHTMRRQSVISRAYVNFLNVGIKKVKQSRCRPGVAQRVPGS
jgi:hypothetical protein